MGLDRERKLSARIGGFWLAGGLLGGWMRGSGRAEGMDGVLNE